MKVKVIGFDDRGKVKFSMKAVDQKPARSEAGRSEGREGDKKDRSDRVPQSYAASLG